MRNIDDFFAKVTKDLDKVQLIIDKEIVKQYLVSLDIVKSDIAIIYEKYSVAGKLTFEEMSKYNRLKNLYADLEMELKPIFKDKNKILKEALNIDYNQTFYRGEWMFDQHTGAVIKWGGLNTKLVKAAVKNPLNKISKPVELALDDKVFLTKIKNTITQGLIQGQGYSEMAVEIDKIYGIRGSDGKLLGKKFKKEIYKSVRIARTEGQRVRNIAAGDQYSEARKQGAKEVDIWDASLDMSTRPEHGALDGAQRQEDGMFHSADFVVSGPGQFGVAALDINCRCGIRPEIIGYEPRLRREMKDVIFNPDGSVTYTKEVRPYETFKTWAERKGIKKNIYGQELKF